MGSVVKFIGLAALCALGAQSAPSIVDTSALSTCKAIGSQVSNSSSLVYAAALTFGSDIEHWFLSSTQVPTCVLEAGSPQDVAIALKLIAKNKTPFAVKSGGHASNPGFSSTAGVHIVFNMKQVTFSPDHSSVELGMGLAWADAYTTLQSSGYNVVGGRTTGPGVGGFTLGGGFSWKTNQFGLTCDTVKAYNMVLPNGTVARVDKSQTDLFFALKGGLNRFGIVTSAEYYTHQQVPTVYGGIAFYQATDTARVVNATHAFYAQNTDPRAQIITTLDGSSTGTSALVLFFYDGPTRPASFSYFDGLVPLLNTVKAQTFASFVNNIPSKLQLNVRGAFHTLSTAQLTPGFLAAVVNESNYWGAQGLLHGANTISYDVEPFLSSYGGHATDSAYPHADAPLPLNLYFTWAAAASDDYWHEAMRQSVAHLTAVAHAEGIMPADYTQYPNYALAGTSAAQLYGASNAARLAAIRKQIDPAGVMELAGGFTL